MGLSIGNRLLGSTGLSNGFGLSVGNGLAFLGFGAAFSPAELFANGEPGAWYDPSDLTTLFQDAAGTTPVTAVEQPVGLMLDKSKGLVLGPELVTNGDFSNGTTGWTASAASTIAAVNGEIEVTATSTSGQSSNQTISNFVIGRMYRVTATFRAAATNTVAKSARFAIVNPGVSYVLQQEVTANGVSRTINLVFTAPATTLNLSLEVASISAWGAIGDKAYFDNISVRELPGNHLTQSTTTARPVLSARYNLLTQTEAFNEAVWLKPGGWLTVNSNADIAPDGTQTADKLIPRANADPYHNATRVTTCGASVHIQSYYVKAAGYNKVGIREDGVVGQWATFLLSGAGSVIAKHASATASITALENSWYRVTLTPSTASANMGTGIYVLDNNYTSGAPDTYAFAGDGTSGVLAWGADFRPVNDGVDLPVYQRVGVGTSGSSSSAGSADYDTTGFPLYLKFDGIDDFMVSPTITPGIDKAQVFAGVRKLSDATVQMLYELSVNTNSNNGAFNALPGYSGAGSTVGAFWTVGSKGTIGAGATTAAIFSAPQTTVHTHLADISNDSLALRLNGTQVAVSAADQGTGNYLAYPLYVGARAGTSFFFNGRLFSLIVRFGATLYEPTINNTELYVSGKMGGGYVQPITGYDYLVDANGDQITDASGNPLYTQPLYS